jgi:hypothetical protein
VKSRDKALLDHFTLPNIMFGKDEVQCVRNQVMFIHPYDIHLYSHCLIDLTIFLDSMITMVMNSQKQS